MNRRVVGIIIVSCVVGMISPVQVATALNETTHAIINEQAARRSRVDVVLKRELGSIGGIEQRFGGGDVVEWLREGGIRETEASEWRA